MDTNPVGEYIALVVRLQADADGKWFIHGDGTAQPFVMPLPPLTLAVRLWRVSETGMLRGIIRLLGDERSAPIQSNAQLEELVRAWLFRRT
jgi:hypothetical protein